MRLLELGLLEDDYPITTFFEDKRFSSFLTNGPIRCNYATVENFKTVLTYLTSQGTALKFMNVIGPFAKELENLLFSKTVVIG